MRRQVYIVSLYDKGQRRPSDCIYEFFDTREDAEGGAAEYMEAAQRERDRDPTLQAAMDLGWIHRFTIRKEWINT